MPILTEEVDFPRGGVESEASKLLPKSTNKTKKSSSKKRHANFLNFGVDTGDKDEEPFDKKFKDDDDGDATEAKGRKSQLRPELCTPGLVALAIVKKIYEDYVLLELSDGRTAKLKSEDVSKQYRQELVKCLKQNMAITPLTELFCIGQLVTCIVVVNNEKKKNNRQAADQNHVCVSTDPIAVNSSLLADNLKKGCLVACSVIAKEDKGYSMDVGVSSLVAFLPASEIDRPLLIGQPLICYINHAPSEGNRVVKLSAKPKKLNCSVLEDIESVVYEQLMPATVVQAAVEKHTPRGCVVRLSPSVVGFVPLKQLPGKHRKICIAQTKSDAPALTTDIEINVIVTFWKANSNILGLSSAPHLLNVADVSSRNSVLNEFKVGNVIKAVVSQVSLKGSVFFTAGKSAMCIAAKDQLNLKELPTENLYEFVISQYPIGNECKVRVVGFSLFDRALFVSARSDVLKQKIISAEEATYGMHLTVKIEKITKQNLFGTVYDGISCRIPDVHITDTKPEKLVKWIKLGQQMKARVLDIDRDKNRLVLTLKPSLVNSTAKLVTCLADFNMKDVIVGVVVQKSKNGLLLAFFGDAKAFCPARNVEACGFSMALVSVGDLMRVKVVRIDTEKANVTVTPVFDIKKEIKEEVMEHQLTLGSNYRATVVEKRLDEGTGGIRVCVEGSGVEAWLPETQLTDCSFEEVGKDFGNSIKNGELLDGVSLVCLHGPCPVVSCKPLLADYNTSGTICRAFDDLKKDMLVYATIHHKHEKLGYFVQIANETTENLIGLASFNQLDKEHPLQVGQTVIAKVSHVDSIKRRFSVVLKDVKCAPSVPFKLLKQALTVRERSRLGYSVSDESVLQSLSALTLGQVVKVKVVNVTPVGCTVKLVDAAPDVQGVITSAYMGSKMKVGKSCEAVVVYIDFQNKCVELVSNETVLKRAKQWDKEKNEKEKEFGAGKMTNAQVLAIKLDFSVVQLYLEEQGGGPLAYLPSRSHPNSPFGFVDETLAPNLKLDNVIIKEKMVGGAPIVLTNARQANAGLLALGDMVQASVVGRCGENRGGGLFVMLELPGGERGRIHATELADKYDESYDPVQSLLDKYENATGPHIQVRIIGHHTFRGTGVVDDNKSAKIKYYECSTRPSKFVTSKKPKTKWLSYAQNVKEGELLPVIVQEIVSDGVKVCVNPYWDGFVPKSYIGHPKLEQMKIGYVYSARVVNRHFNRGMRNIVLTMRKEHFALNTAQLATTCVRKDATDGLPDRMEIKEEEDSEESEITFETIVDKPGVIKVKDEQSKMSEGMGYVGFEWKPSRFSLDRLLNVGIQAADEKGSVPAIVQMDDDTVELGGGVQVMDTENQMNEQDFDKELLGSPNSSQLWISFMAFYLQKGNVIKARMVAEKALSTINYREDNELRNIWVAYLNLENTYGNEEDIEKVFERALKGTDDKKITKQMVKIYQKSSKFERASELCEQMVKKCSDDFEVWVMAGHHELSYGTADKARDYMHRAIKSLPDKQHVQVLSRFAQLEFECPHGDKERGKTMFENILVSYSRRIDLWFLYIDMLVKHVSPEQARPVFERLTALKLNSHKMRSIYKKWIMFEEKFGNEQFIDLVKQKAAVFVEAVKEIVLEDD